jgi:hypothetical protein
MAAGDHRFNQSRRRADDLTFVIARKSGLERERPPP